MSRGWKFYWVWVAATILLYVALVVWAGPKLSGMAGGQAAFDLRTTGYSLAEAARLMNGLTAQGSAFYLEVWYPLDMAFLSFITVAMTLGLFGLFEKVSTLSLVVVTLLPIFYGFADVFENNAVAGLVRGGFFELTPELVTRASQFTQAKFVFFFASVLMILIGLGLRFMKRNKSA